MDEKKTKCVVYKNGTYIFTDVSWEYENDPDWLVTIDLSSELTALRAEVERPVPMILHCPECHFQHIDKAEPHICETCGFSRGYCACETFKAWLNPPHRKHRCKKCNHTFRPALINTVGVESLESLAAEKSE